MNSNEDWHFLATLAPRCPIYHIENTFRFIKPQILWFDRFHLWNSEVHTTGTDTKQPLQSYAALTLSASMTFRDYATLGRKLGCRWLRHVSVTGCTILAKWLALAYQAQLNCFRNSMKHRTNSYNSQHWMIIGWQVRHSASAEARGLANAWPGQRPKAAQLGDNDSNPMALATEAARPHDSMI